MPTHLPAIHSVHIYEQDSDLITRLSVIVSTSLRLGDSVLVIATGEHRQLLIRELEAAGLDVRDCVREGRYSMLDAKDTLAAFMRNGMPDRHQFMSSVGQVLVAARTKAVSNNQSLTVFGEMVAVLWDEGNKAAALELEGLWNEILTERTFHLHCAYPRSGFVNHTDVDAVCHSHSHVLQ
jgi:DcmR-like sensory protein